MARIGEYTVETCGTCGTLTDTGVGLCWRCIDDTDITPMWLAKRVRDAATLNDATKRALRGRIVQYLMRCDYQW